MCLPAVLMGDSIEADDCETNQLGHAAAPIGSRRGYLWAHVPKKCFLPLPPSPTITWGHLVSSSCDMSLGPGSLVNHGMHPAIILL